MTIKQRVWLASSAFILFLSSMIAVSIIYLEGVPLLLSLAFGAAGIILGSGLMMSIQRNIRRGLDRIMKISVDIAQGTLDSSAISPETGDDFGELAHSFHALAVNLEHKTTEERSLRLQAEEQAWINTQVTEMALMLQGSVHLETAARVFIGKLSAAVSGAYGAVYLKQGDKLHFTAGYAFDEAASRREPFALGSGLVGQCALDQKMVVLHDLPEHYIRVHSGLGEAAPTTLILVPVIYEQDVVAVVELATLNTLADKDYELIKRTGRNMGVLINTLADVARIEELLGETQLQKEELEAQTEELQAQTQELEAQTEELLAQTGELHSQTEQLQAQGEELQMQADSLLTSNEQLQRQMELTEEQKAEIEAQADELKLQTEELLPPTRICISRWRFPNGKRKKYRHKPTSCWRKPKNFKRRLKRSRQQIFTCSSKSNLPSSKKKRSKPRRKKSSWPPSTNQNF